MATVAERVGVLETKVNHIDEKIDDIKIDIKDMHDCLDNTRDSLAGTLAAMRTEATGQHNELAAKISEIEKSKDKLMLYGAIGAAFVAGAGWSGAINFPMIVKFFGL
jgi:chaperonin cofactor prefoldin